MARIKARRRNVLDGNRLRSLAVEKRDLRARWERGALGAKKATSWSCKEIPEEVLRGTELDLSVWSVLASDACLATVFRRPTTSSSRRFSLQSNQQMEEGASGPAYRLSLPETIVRLNLSGAEHITDQTAHLIAATCPELKHLDLERACNVSL